MKKLSLALIGFMLFTGCAGVDVFYKTDGDVAYKFEEAYDVGLFTPTYQYRRVSACGVKKVEQVYDGDNGEEEIYTVTEPVEPCKPLYAKHGWGVDQAGPLGPVIMNGSATVGMGALIQDGMRNQNVSPGDTVNIDNDNSSRSKSSAKQFQGQIQGQQQFSKNVNKNFNKNINNNTNKNIAKGGQGGGCRGNCGGGPRRGW